MEKARALGMAVLQSEEGRNATAQYDQLMQVDLCRLPSIGCTPWSSLLSKQHLVANSQLKGRRRMTISHMGRAGAAGIRTNHCEPVVCNSRGAVGPEAEAALPQVSAQPDPLQQPSLSILSTFG